MAIKYIAYTQAGERLEGVLDVESEDAAYERLWRDDLIAYKLSPMRQWRSPVEFMPLLFRPGLQELIDFTRGLATLLRSGIPILDALTSLRTQSRSLGLRSALRQIIADVEAGTRFSEACARHPAIFPGFYIRLLTVGESVGSLPVTLRQAHEFLERRKETGDKVKTALLYPGVSLVVALIAGAVLVTFTLPSLVSLLGEFAGDEEFPATTRLLLAISGFLQSYGVYLAGSIVGGTLLTVAYVRTERGRAMRDRILLHVPVVGSVLLRSNLFSLTLTFGALLKAGVPPVEALHLSAESLDNVVLRGQLVAVTREVSEGNRLGETFMKHGLFPPMVAQGLMTAEISGNLVETLESLADFYQQEAERNLSRATELLQPLVILLVAGMVGFVAIATFSGIYSTIGAIQ